MTVEPTIKITKQGHSPEYLAAEKEYLRKASTCPNCRNELTLPLVRTYGFFRQKQVNVWKCPDCGCEWEPEPFSWKEEA